MWSRPTCSALACRCVRMRWGRDWKPVHAYNRRNYSTALRKVHLPVCVAYCISLSPCAFQTLASTA